jgi:hypothetical protein
MKLKIYCEKCQIFTGKNIQKVIPDKMSCMMCLKDIKVDKEYVKTQKYIFIILLSYKPFEIELEGTRY